MAAKGTPYPMMTLPTISALEASIAVILRSCKLRSRMRLAADSGTADFDAAVHMNIAKDQGAPHPHLQTVERTPLSIFWIEQIEIDR
jgi:hypothetical protein